MVRGGLLTVGRSSVVLGDCLDVMRDLDAASVDSVVTDPPYGISFMGKHWDGKAIEERVGKRDVSKLGVRLTGGIETPNRKETARTASAFANRAGAAGDYDTSPTGNRAFQAWCEEWGAELLRVLKPGGHALVFGGTRTYHRLACGLEDAGFEIRDCLCWLFGSGFPKSLDVSKAIDKGEGHWRGRAGEVESENGSMSGPNYERSDKGDPVTAAVAAWGGWGTALKPAFEPIVVARKPLVGTVAANVLAYGVGALNIDACRIGVPGSKRAAGTRKYAPGTLAGGTDGAGELQEAPHDGLGRWPANVVLDDEAATMLDEQTGELVSGANPTRRGSDKFQNSFGEFDGQRECVAHRGADVGGASRFFYCAKVSRAERNAGLDGFEERAAEERHAFVGLPDRRMEREQERRRTRNHHPTVKPIALMRWLIRLVTPADGTILDPFLGSGSTGCAAALEGFQFIGIEREPDYLAIAEARIAFWREHGEEGLRIVAEREASQRVREEIAAAGQLSFEEVA